MLTTLRAAVALAALALALPASAQQQTSHPRVGLGISMDTNLISPILSNSGAVFAPPAVLYVPFYATPNVRIEPAIGWLRVHDDQNDITSSSFQLGVGAVVLKPITASTNLYVGGRLSSIWDRDETRTGAGLVITKTTQRNTQLALVLGGEYLPTPWFSVGAEAALNFIWLGDVTVEVPGNPNVVTSGGSAQSTAGLLFIRVYFM